MTEKELITLITTRTVGEVIHLPNTKETDKVALTDENHKLMEKLYPYAIEVNNLKELFDKLQINSNVQNVKINPLSTVADIFDTNHMHPENEIPNQYGITLGYEDARFSSNLNEQCLKREKYEENKLNVVVEDAVLKVPFLVIASLKRAIGQNIYKNDEEANQIIDEYVHEKYLKDLFEAAPEVEVEIEYGDNVVFTVNTDKVPEETRKQVVDSIATTSNYAYEIKVK